MVPDRGSRVRPLPSSSRSARARQALNRPPGRSFDIGPVSLWRVDRPRRSRPCVRLHRFPAGRRICPETIPDCCCRASRARPSYASGQRRIRRSAAPPRQSFFRSRPARRLSVAWPACFPRLPPASITVRPVEGIGRSQLRHDCISAVLHLQQPCFLRCVGIENRRRAIEDWIHPVRRFSFRGHQCAGSDKDQGEDERAVYRRISARPYGQIGEKKKRGRKMNEIRLPHARQPRQG